MTNRKNIIVTHGLVRIAVAVGVLALVLLPAISLAQPIANPTGGSGVTSPINSVTGVQDLLNRVLRIMYVIFFIIAAIFIVLAAFKYLTAQGDEEKVGEAKKMLIYAIVAIAVALIATGVSSVVGGVLGGQSL